MWFRVPNRHGPRLLSWRKVKTQDSRRGGACCRWSLARTWIKNTIPWLTLSENGLRLLDDEYVVPASCTLTGFEAIIMPIRSQSRPTMIISLTLVYSRSTLAQSKSPLKQGCGRSIKGAIWSLWPVHVLMDLELLMTMDHPKWRCWSHFPTVRQLSQKGKDRYCT